MGVTYRPFVAVFWITQQLLQHRMYGWILRTEKPYCLQESEELEKAEYIYGIPEKMLEWAKAGYFVRDPENNLVYCSGGEILRQKCIKKNGNILYANKNVCKHCPNRNKCYKANGKRMILRKIHCRKRVRNG